MKTYFNIFLVNKKKRSIDDVGDDNRGSKRERKSVSDKTFERQIQLAIEQSKKDAEAKGLVDPKENNNIKANEVDDDLLKNGHLKTEDKKKTTKNNSDNASIDEIKKTKPKKKAKLDDDEDDIAFDLNNDEDDDDFMQDKKKKKKKTDEKKTNEKKTTPKSKKIKEIKEKDDFKTDTLDINESKNKGENIENTSYKDDSIAIVTKEKIVEPVKDEIIDKNENTPLEASNKPQKDETKSKEENKKDQSDSEKEDLKPNNKDAVKKQTQKANKNDESSSRSSKRDSLSNESFSKPQSKAVKTVKDASQQQNTASPLGRIQIQSPGIHRVGLSRNSKLKPLHPNVKPI